MNQSQPSREAKPTATSQESAGETAAIDSSFRGPLLLLLLFSGAWLLLGSAFGLVASIKFHGPNFLANVPAFTYGRVWPAATNCLLYGFFVPVGVGVTTWIFARLGRVALLQPLLVFVGVLFWNLGVALGVAGILAGDSTGFETLEFPGYATLILLSAYVVLGLCALRILHQRLEKPLYVSQWFSLVALFWFPWIYSTAQMLVTLFPGQGVTPSIVAWWYAENLEVVFGWALGFGVVFYFVPKLMRRPLHSRYLALFAFWLLVLFGGWGGIPNSAPVPSWMPALSAAARMLMALTLLSVLLNIALTIRGKSTVATEAPNDSQACLRFIQIALGAFVLAAFMRVARSFGPLGQLVDLTWFNVAEVRLNNYGFLALALTGAVYYIAARLPCVSLSSTLRRAHFWLAATGVAFACVPLVIAGLVQGAKLGNANVPFVEIANGTLHFLRLSTVGELLILAGNLTFVANLAGATMRFYRGQARAVVTGLTDDLLKPAEVKA